MNDVTGLPELPEGEYWRVREVKFDPFEFPRPMEPYELCIYKTATRETRTPRKWFGIVTGYYTGTETVEECVAKEGIKAKRPRPAGDKLQANPWDSMDMLFHETYDVTLTPQAIRETAESMMAYRAGQQRIKSLLGDYPPNRLAD